ncbi:MAG: ABC transporter ATP-binding protein [Microbacteriaceae bacterium]|nr:ABC transporter ATP-binding protein [Cryobacterium sp.]MBX3104112.1 ABC transporter ATP-binding protein [Cryobacterium sp.]MCC6377008.1 ABC transporter ATP-binding protein [Microbacteriaceae bacterium]
MKALLKLYREVVAVFPFGGAKFLKLYAWLLASLAIFDAGALGLLAIIIGPIAAGQPVKLPFLGKLDTAGVIWMILLICVLMVVKGVLATLLTWWATRKVPRYEVAIGDRLFRAYINAPWRDRLRKNSAEIMRFADSGVDATVNSFVLPGATLLGEFVSLLAIIVTLAIVQPLVAVSTLIYLGLLGVALFFWVAKRARVAGEVHVENTIKASRLVLEIVGAMKEVSLRNKENEVADVVAATRRFSAVARGNMYFLTQVPRYALESGLIVGFVVIGGIGFLAGGVQQAISAVALFALAGFRMAPSVIRVQSVLAQMVSISEFPKRVLKELDETEASSSAISNRPSIPLPKKIETIEFKSVGFKYSESGQPAIVGVNLSIRLGTSVAFVGASGAGKSTIIDLILGLIEPSEGQISIDGTSLSDYRSSWRERVGYVPQEVAMFDASIAQNVALTWGNAFDEKRVISALKQAQLWEFVKSREDGIHSRVGERGLAVSGGQRQRLGIARALYSNPLVLVLDEATSALDTSTEAEVTKAIGEVRGVTKIVVAHRLATIRHVDCIYFLQGGEVLGSGKFEELINKFPDFAQQAALAGLA